MPRYVLDTSLLLAGRERPTDGPCATTQEALSEIKPGGRDARRLAEWQAAGLETREADPAAAARIRELATEAGNLARLSPADRSLLALALDWDATLVTEDHTMLDVAKRTGIPTWSPSTGGIKALKSFRPRCSGCGRWFDAPPGPVCPVCGSAVRDKPTDVSHRAHHPGS